MSSEDAFMQFSSSSNLDCWAREFNISIRSSVSISAMLHRLLLGSDLISINFAVLWNFANSECGRSNLLIRFGLITSGWCRVQPNSNKLDLTARIKTVYKCLTYISKLRINLNFITISLIFTVVIPIFVISRVNNFFSRLSTSKIMLHCSSPL